MRYVVALLGLLAGVTADFGPRIFPNGTRNKFVQPYASSSFWNTAIGSNAKYVPAGINASAHVEVDEDWFVVADETSIESPWFAPHSWEKRCGTSDTYFGWIRFPPNFTVPDATIVPHATPNNAGAVLQPDGETIVNLNPLTRCEANGPVYGYTTPSQFNQSIYGVGQYGGHGGSGLSSIGGTVRKGELLPGAAPIAHALKWELWAARYYYNDGSGNNTCCHQWPALVCDGYWKTVYNGTNPLLRQGSLLAIPPALAPKVNASLTTEPARMLLAALVDYGAYVVDDTYWDAQQFCVEHGVAEEFESAWGFAMSGAIDDDPSPFILDVTRLSEAMHVVANSGPDSIGGGGTPRRPAPPALGN